jgi:hypothetical protein
MKSLFGDYQTYLPQNGWTVIGSDATHSMFSEISANQGTNQLQVVISQVGKGSQVTISYAAH